MIALTFLVPLAVVVQPVGPPSRYGVNKNLPGQLDDALLAPPHGIRELSLKKGMSGRAESLLTESGLVQVNDGEDLMDVACPPGATSCVTGTAFFVAEENGFTYPPSNGF